MQTPHTNNLRRGKISLDCGPTFDAWLMPETWNGAACPWVDEATATRIAESIAAYGFIMTMDDDVWTVMCSDGFIERYVSTKIDGVMYWPIGAFEWSWNEVSVDV